MRGHHVGSLGVSYLWKRVQRAFFAHRLNQRLLSHRQSIHLYIPYGLIEFFNYLFIGKTFHIHDTHIRFGDAAYGIVSDYEAVVTNSSPHKSYIAHKCFCKSILCAAQALFFLRLVYGS